MDLEKTKPTELCLVETQKEDLSSNLKTGDEDAGNDGDGEMYNLDRAFQELGGFGRFQFFIVVSCSILRMTGMHFVYAFAFLTLEQEYVCRDTPGGVMKPCSAEQTICPALSAGTFMEYEVDTTAEVYAINWFVQMGLECASKNRTAMMASSFLISYGVAGVLFFSVPDRWGRRKSFMTFLSINLFAQFLMIFVPTYWARVTGYSLMGLSSQKVGMSYVYLFELLDSSHKSMGSSVINSVDCSVTLFTCFYFYFICSHWMPLVLAVTALSSVTALIFFSVVPESPKWLLLKGRRSEAIEALNRIGSFNGSSNRVPANAQFMESETPQEKERAESVRQSQIGLEASIFSHKNAVDVVSVYTSLASRVQQKKGKKKTEALKKAGTLRSFAAANQKQELSENTVTVLLMLTCIAT